MYKMYIDGILFPVTPSKLSIKVNSKNKTVDLLNEGQVNLIKTPGLSDITIDDLLLPLITQYPFALYRNKKFRSADYFLNWLEKWKKSKEPVKFVFTRTSPNGSKLLYNTNMYVTIEDYEIIEDAKDHGMDVRVKLEMKQYRYWGCKSLIIKNSSSSSSSAAKVTAKTNASRQTKSTAKTYTVKSGDCLYNIAKKELNDASRWREIYNLNKSTIESAAKKHGYSSSSTGHWIFPGTKLNLPD